jgi:hypothetical protein
MPASAALSGVSAAASQISNLFDSSANLSALVGKDGDKDAAVKDRAGAPTSGISSVPARVSSQNLMNRLPSSSAIFPDSISSVSLTGMLPGMSSSARLSSMLSLNSFLSREPSIMDFGLAAGAAGAPPQYLSAFPGIGISGPVGATAMAQAAKKVPGAAVAAPGST